MYHNITKARGHFLKKHQQTPARLHSRPRSTTAASHMEKPEGQKCEQETPALGFWLSRDKAKTPLTGVHKTLLIL